MKKNSITSIIASSLLIFSFSGCSLSGGLSASNASSGAQITAKSPDALKKYTAVYVEPIYFYQLEGETLSPFKNGETTEIAEVFRAKILRGLESKSTSFPQPAGGVLRLKISLSNASTNQVVWQLRSGLVIPHSTPGGAIIEGRFIDSVSGKDILTYRESLAGEGDPYLGVFGTWGGVESAVDTWARELSQIAK